VVDERFGNMVERGHMGHRAVDCMCDRGVDSMSDRAVDCMCYRCMDCMCHGGMDSMSHHGGVDCMCNGGRGVWSWYNYRGVIRSRGRSVIGGGGGCMIGGRSDVLCVFNE